MMISAATSAAAESNISRYEALVRISETLSACWDCEQLARTLATVLEAFLPFDRLYMVFPKEDSKEIESLVWGKGKHLLPDLPLNEFPVSEAFESLEPIHTPDWSVDDRFPRFKEWAKRAGLGLGSSIQVPLTTPHRRLGAFGITSGTVVNYSAEDIDFLRLIARVVAFAIDDGLNLKRAQEAHKCLQHQNERLQLLVDVTKQITSNLEFRELLRVISANIRGVMRCDMVAISLPEGPSEGQRLLALDFPNGKGLIREGLLLTPVGPGRKALESLKPAVVSTLDPDAFPPEVRELAVAEGLQQHCVIPLANRGRALGVLVIARMTDASFSQDDLEFLTQVSGQIAIAVENALAFQKVSALRDRLQLLMNMTGRITSSLDFRELLRSIAANIREVMHCDCVGISLADSTAETFRIFALDFPETKGFVREDLVFSPSKNDPSRHALETMRPVVVTNTAEAKGTNPEISSLVIAEGIKVSCIIPLVNRGRALGTLAVARRTDASFTAKDVEFLSQASGQIAIAVENSLAFQEISELKDKLAQEKVYLEEEFRSEMGFEQIIGNSSALKHVLQLVETAAPSDSTVLLLGETGTGKELIARAIHDRSRRKQRTLVKLNCAAIPTGLLESELFGHEKGAFTGAIAQKIGRLELADQGTLFLDEVGDIPVEVQPKLLRALQEREFERLGSTHTRKVNVRLIAATNRDLEQMVASREFRSDLYYRLNVFPIRIPPLRDRKEDIPLLVSYFVQKFAKEMQKRIEAVPAAVMKGLTAWHWPGNIRELENFIERAVLLTRGKSLEAPLTELRKANSEHSPQADVHAVKQVAGKETRSGTNKSSVADEYERKQRDEIVLALTECKGRVGGTDGAASRLGMNRTTLLSRMKKFGIYSKQYA